MDITVEKRALELVARNSDGAMRDALSLLDQLIAYDSNNITYEDCINILGITSSDLIFELVDAINERDIGKSLEILERVILEGKDIQQFVKDLTYHFRNLMISKVSKNPEELIFTEDVERYIAQSKKFELDDILKCLEILRDTDSNVKWALQPRIVLELAIIKMIEKGEVTKEDKNVSQHEKEEKESIKEEVTKKISKNVEVEKKDSKIVSSADEEKFSLKYVKAQWPKIMQIIKSKKISIYALIMEGEVQRVDDNRIVITYKEGFEFHKNAVNSPQNKEFLEQVLSEYFSTPIELVFLMSNQIDEMKEEVKDIPKEKTKEEKIQEVIDFFGEDLVEIIEEE
jgi:DNA polymerase-3 subunit gamma/tau